MFRCNSCETEFETPAEFTEKHGLDTLPFEEFSCCPKCKSADIEELYECKICGESYPLQDMTTENNRVCNDCDSNVRDSWDRIKRYTLRLYFNEAEREYIEECEL